MENSPSTGYIERSCLVFEQTAQCKNATQGKGCLDWTYKAVLQSDEHRSRPVVVKSVPRVFLPTDPQKQKQITDQIQLNVSMKHPHLVALLGWSQDVRSLCLIVDFSTGVSLDQIISAAKERGEAPYSNSTAWKIMSEITNTLAQICNQAGLYHGRIHPNNVFFADGVYKLADFGIELVRRQLSPRSRLENAAWVMMEQYAAPEMLAYLDGNPSATLDVSCDVYSLAVLLWRLFSKEDVYHGMPWPDARKKIKDGSRMASHTAWTPELSHFVESMWSHEPSQRPTIQRVAEFMQNQHNFKGALGATSESLTAYLRQQNMDYFAKLIETHGLSPQAFLSMTESRLTEEPFRTPKFQSRRLDVAKQVVQKYMTMYVPVAANETSKPPGTSAAYLSTSPLTSMNVPNPFSVPSQSTSSNELAPSSASDVPLLEVPESSNITSNTSLQIHEQRSDESKGVDAPGSMSASNPINMAFPLKDVQSNVGGGLVPSSTFSGSEASKFDSSLQASGLPQSTSSSAISSNISSLPSALHSESKENKYDHSNISPDAISIRYPTFARFIRQNNLSIDEALNLTLESLVAPPFLLPRFKAESVVNMINVCKSPVMLNQLSNPFPTGHASTRTSSTSSTSSTSLNKPADDIAPFQDSTQLKKEGHVNMLEVSYVAAFFFFYGDDRSSSKLKEKNIDLERLRSIQDSELQAIGIDIDKPFRKRPFLEKHKQLFDHLSCMEEASRRTDRSKIVRDEIMKFPHRFIGIKSINVDESNIWLIPNKFPWTPDSKIPSETELKDIISLQTSLLKMLFPDLMKSVYTASMNSSQALPYGQNQSSASASTIRSQTPPPLSPPLSEPRSQSLLNPVEAIQPLPVAPASTGNVSSEYIQRQKKGVSSIPIGVADASLAEAKYPTQIPSSKSRPTDQAFSPQPQIQLLPNPVEAIQPLPVAPASTGNVSSEYIQRQKKGVSSIPIGVADASLAEAKYPTQIPSSKSPPTDQAFSPQPQIQLLPNPVEAIQPLPVAPASTGNVSSEYIQRQKKGVSSIPIGVADASLAEAKYPTQIPSSKSPPPLSPPLSEPQTQSLPNPVEAIQPLPVAPASTGNVSSEYIQRQKKGVSSIPIGVADASLAEAKYPTQIPSSKSPPTDRAFSPQPQIQSLPNPVEAIQPLPVAPASTGNVSSEYIQRQKKGVSSIPIGVADASLAEAKYPTQIPSSKSPPTDQAFSPQPQPPPQPHNDSSTVSSLPPERPSGHTKEINPTLTSSDLSVNAAPSTIPATKNPTEIPRIMFRTIVESDPSDASATNPFAPLETIPPAVAVPVGYPSQNPEPTANAHQYQAPIVSASAYPSRNPEPIASAYPYQTPVPVSSVNQPPSHVMNSNSSQEPIQSPRIYQSQTQMRSSNPLQSSLLYFPFGSGINFVDPNSRQRAIFNGLQDMFRMLGRQMYTNVADCANTLMSEDSVKVAVLLTLRFACLMDPSVVLKMGSEVGLWSFAQSLLQQASAHVFVNVKTSYELLRALSRESNDDLVKGGALLILGDIEAWILEDKEASFKYRLQSSQLHFLPAFSVVADCYLNGYGTNISYSDALDYYNYAAMNYDVFGDCGMGMMLAKGLGCDVDLEGAISHLMNAASRHIYGRECIAFFYEKGIGVPCDLNTAWRCYNDAAIHGSKYASRRLEQLSRNYS